MKIYHKGYQCETLVLDENDLSVFEDTSISIENRYMTDLFKLAFQMELTQAVEEERRLAKYGFITLDEELDYKYKEASAAIDNCTKKQRIWCGDEMFKFGLNEDNRLIQKHIPFCGLRHKMDQYSLYASMLAKSGKLQGD